MLDLAKFALRIVAVCFIVDRLTTKVDGSFLGIKLWSWEFWAAALAVTMLLIAIWDYVDPRKEDKDKKPRTEVIGKPLIAFILFCLAIHWWANRGDVWQLDFVLDMDNRDQKHSVGHTSFSCSGVTKVTQGIFESNVHEGRTHVRMFARRRLDRDDQDSNEVHYYTGTVEATGCKVCPRRHIDKLEVWVTMASPSNPALEARARITDERGTVWQVNFWQADMTEAHDPDVRKQEEDKRKGVVPGQTRLAATNEK